MANLMLPKLDITDFDIEIFHEDTTIQPLKLPEGKTMAEIFKDPRTPILAFTGALWKEIRYCVEKHPTKELALFLVIKRMAEKRPHFLAFDMFMPKQNITGASVQMDGESCQAYYNALKDHPYFQQYGFQKNLCHLHSHGGFATFWSSTDDTEQFSADELGFYDDYRLYVVVNAKGDIKASLVNYYPTLYRVDCATALFFAKEEYARELTPARKKELDAMMEENMEQARPPLLHCSNSRFPATGSFSRTGGFDWYGAGLWTKRDRSWVPPLHPGSSEGTGESAVSTFRKAHATASSMPVDMAEALKIMGFMQTCLTEIAEGANTIPAEPAETAAFFKEAFSDYAFLHNDDFFRAARLLVSTFKTVMVTRQRVFNGQDAEYLAAYVACLAKIRKHADVLQEFGLSDHALDAYTFSTNNMLSEYTIETAIETEGRELEDLIYNDLSDAIENSDVDSITTDEPFSFAEEAVNV